MISPLKEMTKKRALHVHVVFARNLCVSFGKRQQF